MIKSVNLNVNNKIEWNQNTAKKTATANFNKVLNNTIGSSVEIPVKGLNEIFNQASREYQVPLSLLKAVAKQESNFTVDAVSRSGAQGVMQLMPATAKSLGVEDSFDPEQNIMGGAKYLSMMLEKYDGNTKLALAAYNAGSGNVAKYGGVPPFKETQEYVVKVMNYMKEDFSVPNVSTEVSKNTSVKSNTETAPVLPTIPTLPKMTEEAKELVFSYDDYTNFLEEWKKQMQWFRIEDNIQAITSGLSEDES